MNSPSHNGRDVGRFNVCRCCLIKEASEVISYEHNDVGKAKAYGKLLEDVFNIQISQELDKYFCNKCISKLLEASSFKDMVIKNEETYLEYLKRLHEKESDTRTDYLKMEVIKLEDTNEMDFNVPDNSYDDDDDQVIANPKETYKIGAILESTKKRRSSETVSKPEKAGKKNNSEVIANLKDTDKSGAILESTKKRRSSETVSKPEKARKKTKESNIGKQGTINTEKLLEHRGTGPILRENSLKLLAHSTAVVFQWDKSRYRCFCCKEPFSDINLLRTHTNSHSLNEIQRKIIAQQNRLVKVEISSLICKLCNKELKDLDVLREHLLDHNIVVDDHLLVPFKIENELKCQICSEPFTRFRLLNIHMNKHYQKHVCHVCGAGFPTVVFFNLHQIRSHHPIRCKKCDIRFENRTDKKLHDKEIHGLDITRKIRFPCSFCSERFLQENLRVIHLVEKHGMKKPELRCQFCSKCYITKSLLNNHVKSSHMKQRKHECDVCHSLFYTKSDLARHWITHTGEKNHACKLCNNPPFATKASLKRHMNRTHVGQ